MLHLSLTLLTLGLAFAGLIALSIPASRPSANKGLWIGWGVLTGTAMLGTFVFPAPVPVDKTVYPLPIVGLPAGLQLGLAAQTQLPPPRPTHPQLTWLGQTLGGRTVIHKPIVPFRRTAATAWRQAGIRRYFFYRYGWKDAVNTAFEPRALIVHSTEGEDEAHAWAIFDRSTSAQYMGGIWTHFSVGPEGRIYQYGPLNRISKGQAGLDDSSAGIEIVGTASLWDGLQGENTRTGSIIERWQSGDKAQLLAVADLIATLRRHFAIPAKRVYSHEELGHVREFRETFPDMGWLRTHIRDRVYLGLEPTRDANLKPVERFDFLEPYDRKDPGRDVMEVLRRLMADG